MRTCYLFLFKWCWQIGCYAGGGGVPDRYTNDSHYEVIWKKVFNSNTRLLVMYNGNLHGNYATFFKGNSTSHGCVYDTRCYRIVNSYWLAFITQAVRIINEQLCCCREKSWVCSACAHKIRFCWEIQCCGLYISSVSVSLERKRSTTFMTVQ